MIRLKPYVTTTVSLEQLDAYQHLSVGLESHPVFFGVEEFDLKGKLLKMKEVVIEALKALGRFIASLWAKITGSDQEARVDDVETKLLSVEKMEPEVTEEVSEAIKDVVEQNKTLSTDPVVPEGLPKNLYTRLIRAHDAFYNVGAMVFQNDVINDTEYFNKLCVAVVELVTTHSKAITRVMGSTASEDTYVQDVLQSQSYAEVKKLLTSAGVDLNEFSYAEAFYTLNQKATQYQKTPYFVLDVNVNTVYKAKLGELKQGVRVMRDKLKDDVTLRNRAAQQETTLNRQAKTLTSDDDIQKTRTYTKSVTELVKAMSVTTRLRQQAFNINIDFIEAVIAVMQHHSFRKGK